MTQPDAHEDGTGDEQGAASQADPGLTHWIHAGSCKICGDGMRRVRRSRDEAGKAHYFLLCDECEAIWLTPDQRGEQQYADVENPKCPITGLPLYGEHAGWATADEVKELAWASAIEFTSVDSGESVSDSPASDSDNASTDSSYGQDEPRPGC